ncbi:MAG TPA: stage II sporulation protein M [Thermoanaerobaculia bacterium]|nr:stage II sporulation protein M [Thermoanaerobaculia bacterium]
MDYARFVRLRRPLWDGFEKQLHSAGDRLRGLGYGDLEEMALRYRQVLHDHALAGSRFPGTAAARRLRDLALEGTRRLTGERRERMGVLGFFLRGFPAAFQRHLGAVGVATALFLLAAAWGMALGVLRPGLGLTILGPEAVQGLEEGRLWTESLVTTMPPALSSSGIATNNISVALMAWSGGILAGVLTLYVLLVNGLLLGTLVGVTMHYSMAGELLEFVSAHGPLEITLILVASAAGLAIGRAVVTAGDKPRSLALREAAMDALFVLLGCIPWFVILALVEVFVSPAPDIPVLAKVALGLALEGLFLALAFRSLPSEATP